MSKGILIFAHNNNQIDYGLISVCSALMAKSHHNVPVCLVSDQSTINWFKTNVSNTTIKKAFDEIILIPEKSDQKNLKGFFDGHFTKHLLPWHNSDRPKAYELSPFDETILIDSDYLIMDDVLENCWGHSEEILCNHHAVRLDRQPMESSELTISQKGPVMYWATVLYFKKSDRAKILFDLMAQIHEEYDYYRYVYQLPGEAYRNDFSLSIALHMMNNFMPSNPICSLPNSDILTAWTYDEIYKIAEKDSLLFINSDEKDKGKYRLVNVKKVSVHVFNKFSIVRNANDIIKAYTNIL